MNDEPVSLSPQYRLVIEQLRCLRQGMAPFESEFEQDEQLRLDTLDGETAVLDEIRDEVRRTLTDEEYIHVIRAQEQKYAQRRQRFEKRAAMRRLFVKEALLTLGLKRLPAAEFTASVGIGPEYVVVTDIDALPDLFVRVTKTPDKIALKPLLKKGEKIAGAVLSNGEPVLTISQG